MRKSMKVSLVTLMMMSCLSMHGVVALGDDLQIKFDFSKSHGFGGFGAQIWNPSDHPVMLASLLKDEGFRVVRTSVKPKLLPGELKDGVSSKALADAMLRNDDARSKENLDSLASLLSSAGIKVNLIVWGMPDPWVIEKSYQQSGKTTNGKIANPQHIQDYANYVAATVSYARQRGLQVVNVEISNEPDGDWNTHWSPDDFCKMVVAARKALDADGLQAVGIEGPATSTEAGAVPFMQALIATHATSSLAAISVHDWDSHNGTDPIGLSDPFRRAIDPLHGTLPVHVTEFNDQAKRWLEPAGSDGQKPKVRTASPEFAVALAVEALRLIGDGASEAILWEAEDLGWEKGNLGLIDIHGNLKPSTYALKTFISLAPSGSKAVGGVASGGVVGTAFLGGDKVVVALVNPTDLPHTIEASLQGLDFKLQQVKSALSYSASNPTAMQNLGGAGSGASISQDLLKLTLAPQTVTTLEITK